MNTTEPVDTLEPAGTRPRYDEYEDSGVEWLGEIPIKWSTTTIKWLSEISYGLSQPPAEKEDGIPFVRATNISEGSISAEGIVRVDPSDVPDEEGVILREGDLLVVRSGAYTGDSAFVDEEFEGGVAGYDMIVRTTDEIIPRYLSYFFLSSPFKRQVRITSGRTAQAHLNAEELGRFEVTVPELEEQRAIAAFLDRETERIDALIEKKEQLIDLLKEKRTALISRVVTKGLDGDVVMQDSGVEWLGEIPAHWDTVKLKWNTDKIGSGVTPDGGSEAYVDNGITFLRSQNVHFDGLRLDDVAYIDEETDREMESTRVYPRDVLLNITGASIGRCTLIPRDFPRANVNQHVCIIRPQQDELHPSYVNHVMASTVGQNQIFAEIDGASRDAVTFAEIGNFIVPKPPKEEQDRISDYIDRRTSQIHALIDQIEEGVQLLNEYRTALISAAVTGQIDVRGEVEL